MSNRPIPETISYTYERVDPEYPVPAPVTQAELEQMPAEETRTVEIERTEAEELLEEINDAVEQRQRNRTIEELVLGVEEYIVADTYCRYAYDQPFGNWYGLDVTVVPGSMIAPVVPNRVRREEYLQESDSLQPHKGPSGTSSTFRVCFCGTSLQPHKGPSGTVSWTSSSWHLIRDLQPHKGPSGTMVILMMSADRATLQPHKGPSGTIALTFEQSQVDAFNPTRVHLELPTE